jgi:hypothetical protein
MSSCGAPEVANEVDPALLLTQAIIEGRVCLGETPATGYARLHDAGGDFAAEVPLNANGQYRFFARPATWTVKVLVPGKSAEKQVVVQSVGATKLEFSL